VLDDGLVGLDLSGLEACFLGVVVLGSRGYIMFNDLSKLVRQGTFIQLAFVDFKLTV